MSVALIQNRTSLSDQVRHTCDNVGGTLIWGGLIASSIVKNQDRTFFSSFALSAGCCAILTTSVSMAAKLYTLAILVTSVALISLFVG